MANKYLLQPMDGTPAQISFANFAGDFNPTAGNDLREGTDTETELVLLNLADAAAAQSAQADLGAHFVERYKCKACIEMQVAVAGDGTVLELWWSESSSATAATGNTGGASGSAGAYSGYSADLETAKKQMTFIGNMSMTDDAVDSTQIGNAGELYPGDRYGSLIIINKTGQTVCDTDDIEAHVVLIPVIPELQ